ncbi:MAG TPA: efflux RND transporter periplasmic adaptor subunit [Thermoanaerobaculia bacterium]|nr:efflux RND transporter periplasmic adaptor subunit [Thermoanaerobaculia bacterium]
MKKRVLIIAGVAVVLVALVFISIKAGGRQRGTRVYAEEASRRDISRIVKASGQIDPRTKVNISAHVVGKIEKLYVKEGDEIAAGRPFLDLERDIFVALHDAAAAQLEILRSRLRQAELQLADSEVKLKRARRLAGEKVLSAEQLEAAELLHSSARQGLQQARDAVVQGQADLKKAREDLTKTTIYSPLTGRVIALNAKEGEVVVSGTMNNPASVIGTIADLSEVLSEVDVDETEIVHVKLGQPAKVKVDAVPDRDYAASVVEIGSSGYNRPQQPDVTFFKVKLLLEKPDDALRPGMSARAEVRTATSAAALIIPIQAVVDRPPLKDEKGAAQANGAAAATGATGPARRDGRQEEEIKVVFVAEKDKAVQRPVTVGLSDETSVEVLTGVAENEKVLTGPYRALKNLKHGDAIKISKESEDGDEGEDDGEEEEDD